METAEEIKNLVRRALGFAGLRVTRARPENRFQAMEPTLHRMKTAGFAPGVIIDAGANMGQWFQMARRVYPNAIYHLIEPQLECQQWLADAAAGSDSVHIHCTAVTQPGVSTVRMTGGGGVGGSGAWVTAAMTGDDVEEVRATTLDALVAGQVSAKDRAMLKLDLEGHELPALKGASLLLSLVESVVTEVRFFDDTTARSPIFADVVDFLREREFELYDIAALAPRPRDQRLRMGDVVFVRRGSALLADKSWV